MKCYLCIDAGTTNLKAGLFDETGNLLGLSGKTLKTVMPKIGYCEMDMNELWDSVCEVISELQIRHAEHWNLITAVGVSAQGEGAWLLDKDNNPVRKAILWNDIRSDTIDAEHWDRAQAFCSEHHITPLCPGSYLAILHWLKRHEPDSYHRIERILYCKDWINFKLTGSLQTDYTDSSTTAFNIFTKQYEKDIFDLLDLSEMKSALLKAYPSGSIVAVTNAAAEAMLGIRTGTPVAAGALDVVSVAVGLGVSRKGHKGSVIGTSLGNLVVLSEDEAKADSYTGGSVLCHVESNTYLRQMSSLSGALVLDWCRREIADTGSFQEMEQLALSVSPGAEGLVFLPYLFGERAPFQAPEASAAFHGLRFHHSKAHMIRSVYESLAYVLYDCYQHMPPGNEGIQIAGGASKSDFLCQVISDVSNQKVCRTLQKELGLFGMYRILSGMGDHTVEKGTEFNTDMANHEIYLRQFERFKKLRRIYLKE
jgi:sugar (pentulose or hexulose) kinase